jgi:hypothetical protein
MSKASDISQRKRTVILSEAKNLWLFEIDAAIPNRDVGKLGLMLRISLRHFVQHDSVMY